MRVLSDDVIETDYGQFDVVWNDDPGFDGNPERTFGGQVNGWMGAASGQVVYVNLATIRGIIGADRPPQEATRARRQ